MEQSFEIMNPHSSIKDDVEAEKAACEIREIKQEAERLSGICKAQIDFYAARMKQIQDKADREVETICRKLEDYFETVPQKRTKTQATYQLPSATLKRKQQQPEYRRNDALLMEAFPDFVQQKPSFQWAEFKKTLRVEQDGEAICTDTGEIVPKEALEVIAREPVFTVEV